MPLSTDLRDAANRLIRKEWSPGETNTLAQEVYSLLSNVGDETTGPVAFDLRDPKSQQLRNLVFTADPVDALGIPLIDFDAITQEQVYPTAAITQSPNDDGTFTKVTTRRITRRAPPLIGRVLSRADNGTYRVRIFPFGPDEAYEDVDGCREAEGRAVGDGVWLGSVTRIETIDLKGIEIIRSDGSVAARQASVQRIERKHFFTESNSSIVNAPWGQGALFANPPAVTRVVQIHWQWMTERGSGFDGGGNVNQVGTYNWTPGTDLIVGSYPTPQPATGTRTPGELAQILGSWRLVINGTNITVTFPQWFTGCTTLAAVNKTMGTVAWMNSAAQDGYTGVGTMCFPATAMASGAAWSGSSGANSVAAANWYNSTCAPSDAGTDLHRFFVRFVQ